MKVYNHGVSVTSYPVGAYYQEVYRKFMEISKFFFNKIPVSQLEDKTINLFCTGSSGLITASIFAGYAQENYSHVFSQIRIIDIKKHGERAHGESFTFFDPDEDNNFNIIIDDFISSGETLRKLIFDIKDKLMRRILCDNTDVKFNSLILSGYVDGDYQELIQKIMNVEHVFGKVR